MASSRVLRSIAPPVFERGRRGGGIGGSSLLLLLLSLGGAGAARLAGATPSRVNVPSEGRRVMRGGVHLESRYVGLGDGGQRGGEGWAQQNQVQRSAAGALRGVWCGLHFVAVGQGCVRKAEGQSGARQGSQSIHSPVPSAPAASPGTASPPSMAEAEMTLCRNDLELTNIIQVLGRTAGFTHPFSLQYAWP